MYPTPGLRLSLPGRLHPETEIGESSTKLRLAEVGVAHCSRVPDGTSFNFSYGFEGVIF
jgi:hypothetical protein